MKNQVDNQKGFALILTLIILFLMSILGTMIFSTTTTEVQISRNYSLRQDAFYAADRGMEYALSDGNIYLTIGTGTLNLPLTGVSLASSGTNSTGTVQYAATGNPPRGSGVDVTQFKANYFVVNMTGTGQGNSNVELEANIARIVPKD